MRALVADDETDIRAMTMKMLLRRGFEVTESVDGADAIQRLRSMEYQLLVLDLMMPRVDGFAVLDYLTGALPSMLERTIVATAYPRTANFRGIPGVCTLLLKPFDLQQFDAAVAACRARSKRNSISN